jgi:hypothetical protein
VAIAVAGLGIGGAVVAADFAAFTSYSLVVAGVLAATWYAGLRFGLAAVALAVALSWVFIAEPHGELRIEPAEFFRLGIGMATAVGGALLLDTARRGWRAADYRAARGGASRGDLARCDSQLADALPVLISYVDMERRFAFNNRNTRTGLTPVRRDRGEHCATCSAALERIRGYVDQALNGKQVSFRRTCHTSAGTRWVPTTSDFAPDGAVRGFFALIAVRPNASAPSARRERARAEAILEAAQDGSSIDQSGRVESFNAAAGDC